MTWNWPQILMLAWLLGTLFIGIYKSAMTKVAYQASGAAVGTFLKIIFIAGTLYAGGFWTGGMS